MLLLTGTFISLRIFVEGSLREQARTIESQPGAGGPGAEGALRIAWQDTSRAAENLRITIEHVFTGAAVAAFVVVFFVSMVSARSIGRPLKAIASSLRESESRGKLLPIEISSRVVEIDKLVEAFNRASRAVQDNEDKLTRAHVEFIEAMASALDARDVYTSGHSRRVAEFACATAIEMGLSQEQIDVIRVGALLHDVGKIGIPDAILLKPRALSPEEVLAVQMHPTVGRRILERIEGFAVYLPIVELHHENHDGTGYPHGLKGGQVPLETRIVHVVDAFDAMTSDRPYRHGMSAPEALGRLRAAAGTQFDPAVVEALHRLRGECLMPDSKEPSIQDFVHLARGLAMARELPVKEPSDKRGQS